MSYYIRIFGTENAAPTIAELREWTASAGGSLKIGKEDIEDRWSSLTLLDNKGQKIATLARISVGEDMGTGATDGNGAGHMAPAKGEKEITAEKPSGEGGSTEVARFLSETKSRRPAPSAQWVVNQLDQCQIIYRFQILYGMAENNGWEVFNEVLSALRDYCGGIVHSEAEGFTNEDGCQITWEFSDDVTGIRNMAIWENNGWTKFKMDLANRKQRMSFLNGQVPAGAEMIED